MRLVFLGTSTSSGVPVLGCSCSVCSSDDPRNKRQRSSILIETKGKTFVIDTGPDFRMQCLQQKVSHLDAVLYTHPHFDHVGGIDDVKYYTFDQNLTLRADHFCLRDLKERFPHNFGNTQRSLGSSRANFSPGTIRWFSRQWIAGIPFDFFPVQHGTWMITSFRMGPLAYMTDCNGVSSASMRYLKNVDTLVVGALRFERSHPNHWTIEEALAFIEHLQPRRAYLIHMGHEVDHQDTSKRLPKNVYLAYDGLELSFDHENESR